MSNSSATPWIVAFQAPLSMGFPRQGYWRGLPFPSQGTLPNPGIELISPSLTGRFFTTEPPRKSRNKNTKLDLEKWAFKQSQRPTPKGDQVISMTIMLGWSSLPASSRRQSSRFLQPAPQFPDPALPGASGLPKSLSNIPRKWDILEKTLLCPPGMVQGRKAKPWLIIYFSSVAQSCPTLCDPMNHSTPGLPVHHQLPEFTQTHVH